MSVESSSLSGGEAPAAILSGLDIAVTVAYVVGVVALGCWAGLRHRRGGGEAKEYFLAGGTLRWPVIGNFEWMAAFTLVLLGLFFAPFYIRSGVATLPDFLERRYNRACRDWLAVLSIVSAVTIHIGFSFLTGGIVLAELFDINMYTGIIVVAALTGLYTIIGGLMAVVITEAIQTIVLVLGAAVITYFAWDKMGGWNAMTEVLEGEDQLSKLSMLRDHGDADGLPWYAVFLGYPVLGIWYWCADQTIVQRVLGAKDEQHARVGPLFAGLIKILPVFIFVLPGLFAYTLVQSGGLDVSSLTSVNESGESVVDSKGIYGVMITQLLPQGLIGLMVAALLAALMSTVAGALNSISTLFSYDLYKRFRPQASDHQLVLVGRLTAGIALLLAIGLVPLLNGYPSIFNGLNDIIAHIAPPITCVFMLGVFWPKASATSAKLTLWFGSALGAVVYALGKIDPGAMRADNVLFKFLANTPFMMMAFYLLCVCVAMQVTFTCIWPAGERERNSKLYWSHPLDPLKDKGWPGIGNYKFLSLLLIGIMAILYYIFT